MKNTPYNDKIKTLKPWAFFETPTPAREFCGFWDRSCLLFVAIVVR